MPHGKEAKLRRAASRAVDPSVLDRRLAHKEEELREKDEEMQLTLQMLGDLEAQNKELLTLMNEQREANQKALQEAVMQVEAFSKGHENDLSSFVFSWALDRKMAIKAGGCKINVLELLRTGRKILLYLDIKLASEARTIKGSVHTLVIAFDVVETARRLGLQEQDPYDAAVAVVRFALHSPTPIPLQGSPRSLYLHTAAAVHARMPTDERYGRVAMLWGSKAAADSQHDAESWLNDTALQRKFPVTWIGTDTWGTSDVETVARQSTGVTGMGQLSVLRVEEVRETSAKKARV